MAILTAGGIYKNKEDVLTGGHLISALTAQHTYDEVYIIRISARKKQR